MAIYREAAFAAGCFWGVEEAFLGSGLPLIGTRVGYCGGTTVNPTYQTVCSGRTGHAETVHIKYDPTTTKYSSLLDVFWTCHNPTTKDRQGPDIGTQYRSMIFCYGREQLEEATQSLQAMGEKLRPGEIVTKVVQVRDNVPIFYPAEDNHQQYLRRSGMDGMCGLR